MAVYTVARADTATAVTAASTEEDARTYLERNPRGAYTTARTVQLSKIFELDAHVERLASTAALMWPDQDLPADLVEAARLRPLVTSTLRAAMNHYRHTTVADPTLATTELKFTILLIWHSDTCLIECLCHACALPPRPCPPINVEIRGAPRTNAKAKDSAWVKKRKHLEALKSNDVNEIVLHDESGALLEGTQTNFYAIIKGKLYTAGEGVLEGTVRRLLLQICAVHDVPVILDPPPNIEDLRNWEGALLSSTSRLALPIDWIGVPKEGKPFAAGDLSRAFNYDDRCLTRRLVRWVEEEVAQVSMEP
ncbi:thioredoxin-like protein [Nannochloropsis oceanica]